MSDLLAARIRTAWPLFVGHVAALLGAWVFRLVGVEVDSLLLLEVVSFALSWAVWEVGTRLEKLPNPVLGTVGRWLVSAGRQIGAPTYGKPGEVTVKLASESEVTAQVLDIIRRQMRVNEAPKDPS